MSAIRPRKLGHIVLQVADIHASVQFYTDILGLTVSDWISDQMVFLRAGTDHHDLALAQIPAERIDPSKSNGDRTGLEHFSYLVEGLDEMEAAATFLQERGIEIVRGIGKHGPGENLFLVFKDPDGNNVEIYADMKQITLDDAHVPAVWARDIDSFDQWRFAKFVVPPPSAVVTARAGIH
jgi:catechol-2,3-dioxygenase